ncbi:MAG TPA: biotin-dependent carboxyltransferase family protein [Flavisolibacter sp.]|nr:biotin-dependent carboxyltransferase family protein [Flavisolibacter sp.]
MSLRITRTGLLDTVQDGGRMGYQHLGIGPGGPMDRFSARLANALLGKPLDSPVIELHFPAATLLFEKPAIICLCGADFMPCINGEPVPMHHPIVVNSQAVLSFEKKLQGTRVYLALLAPLVLESWLGSYSTSIIAGTSGWLKKDDSLYWEEISLPAKCLQQKFTVLPWKTNDTVDWRNEVEFIMGSEWHWLSPAAKEQFQHGFFQLTKDSDRMGFRMAGQKLETGPEIETLVSSAVSFGTVQLLPDGQLIVLMADHQTTGGYPRIAHVISAHLPILAQKGPSDIVQFRMTSLEAAEQKLLKQQKYLEQLQIACKFRIENLLHEA